MKFITIVFQVNMCRLKEPVECRIVEINLQMILKSVHRRQIVSQMWCSRSKVQNWRRHEQQILMWYMEC